MPSLQTQRSLHPHFQRERLRPSYSQHIKSIRKRKKTTQAVITSERGQVQASNTLENGPISWSFRLDEQEPCAPTTNLQQARKQAHTKFTCSITALLFYDSQHLKFLMVQHEMNIHIVYIQDTCRIRGALVTVCCRLDQPMTARNPMATA